jgi:hypothetical protein
MFIPSIQMSALAILILIVVMNEKPKTFNTPINSRQGMRKQQKCCQCTASVSKHGRYMYELVSTIFALSVYTLPHLVIPSASILSIWPTLVDLAGTCIMTPRWDHIWWQFKLLPSPLCSSWTSACTQQTSTSVSPPCGCPSRSRGFNVPVMQVIMWSPGVHASSSWYG